MRLEKHVWLTGGMMLVLFGLGLLVLNSISPEIVATQVVAFMLGGLTGWGFLLADWQELKKWPGWWWGVALALLTLPFVTGDPLRGSSRWINLFGVYVQTSELARPWLIFALAVWLGEQKQFNLGFVWQFLLRLLLPVAVLLLQPDLGTAMLVLLTGLWLMWLRGWPVKHGLIAASGMVLAAPYLWNQLHQYQKERILAFLQPGADKLDRSYNVLQSLIAIGSGGVQGRGVGEGIQSHLKFLPESHNDFVFASLSEELGFLGSVVLFALYWGLFFVLSQAVRQIKDPSLRLAGWGLVAMWLLQVVVNIGMNQSLLPVTGMTLPLISSGGSSLVATGMTWGMILGMARRQQAQSQLEIH